MSAERVLHIRDLHVGYPGTPDVLQGIDIDIDISQTTAVIGHSGSGKSTLARALMRMLPDGASTVGTLTVDDAPFLPRPGVDLGYIPQDPTTGLDPLQRIGGAIVETARVLGVHADAAHLLEEVGLSDVRRILRSYPHQLSGGQRQRVLIALSLLASPRLVVADEPTSALDATVARGVLDLIAARASNADAGLLLITHDVQVALERADRIIVMSDGRIVEDAKPASLGSSAVADEMLAAVASLRGAPMRDPDTPRANRVVIAGEHLRRTYGRGRLGRGSSTVALDDATFDLQQGETLGVVGQSGSGKTTLSRLVLQLSSLDSGALLFDGRHVEGARGADLRSYRRAVQPVFQNPYASLDPVYTVSATLSEAVRLGGGVPSGERIAELLETVGLDPAVARSLPSELSGGMQQRVAIARALAFDPRVIVCDEAVSALDVVVQQRILRLLVKLQRERGLSYLFISHDLAVVRSIAHRVIVLRDGEIVESGDTADVLMRPQHPYTQGLVAAMPGGSEGSNEQ